MNKFENKYRIPSARLQSWDYSSSGMYYVTINTKNQKQYFGEIKNDEVYLNELGLIAQDEWLKTPEIRPDMNLRLGEFIVMPNHFHGIILIGENEFNNNSFQKNKFGPQKKNLGSIMRGYKSSVTTFARNNHLEFEWHERYHDHIIRNFDDYLRITNYIINNPKNGL